MESFRYFPFFEKKVVEGENYFSSTLDFEKLGLGSFITCSGNENSLWFGSGDGYIYEVGLRDGLLSITESWKAYEVTVFDIRYSQNTLITIGMDSNNMWKLKLYDCLDGNILSSRLDKYQELPIHRELGERGITVFEACCDNQFVGLGTVDDFGVFILCGDFFGVDTYSSHFIELSEPCTGIHFISSNTKEEYYIMISTKNSILSYEIGVNTKIPKLIYNDTMGGARLNCSSILSSWTEDASQVSDVLVVFREEGLFCYHPVNGNCSALPTNHGNPIILSTFKNYLVLVSSPLNISSEYYSNNSREQIESLNTTLCDVTICNYFPELRCICYTGEFKNVSHILKGLNMLFVLCSGNNVFSTSASINTNRKNMLDNPIIERRQGIQNNVLSSSSSNNNHNSTTNSSANNSYITNTNITIPNLLFHLEELNLFERIQILISKNLYEWALILAKNENVSNSIYSQIQRAYGDWLCNIRKDYSRALNCYINCLDSFSGDTSHVIHNFLQANRLDEAITYLKECVLISRSKEYSKGVINITNNEESRFTIGKDHVTLLYRLFAQLDRLEDIMDFLQNRNLNEEIDNFEVETAIDMCRSYNKFEIAGKIAEMFQFHDKYMQIQLEDRRSPTEALEYLEDINLDEPQKLSLILKYGPVLINKIQKQTTKFIKNLVIEHNMPIDVFLPIFVDHDNLLLEMAWDVLTKEGNKSQIELEDIETISVELCIHILQVSLRQSPKSEIWAKLILERLIRVDNSENWHSILCICIYYEYISGVFYISQHCNLHQFAITELIKKGEIQDLIEFCKLFGNKDPFIWQEALCLIIKKLSESTNKKDNCELIEYLKVILENVHSLKLISPLSILEILSKYLVNNNSSSVENYNSLTFQIIKPILALFSDYNNENLSENSRNSLNDISEINRMKKEIKDLKQMPKLLNTSRCNQCHLPLELPIIHFLCDHSFHRYCLLQQDQCPICSSDQQTKIRLLKQRENQQINKEQFFKFIKGDTDNSLGFDHISKSLSVLFK
ncbi:vacuolar protein sorting 11 [Cryptosporidium ubiquitum]|uniref:Vacuolar protein sorting 11 n=1 Tax=Cryptosporidium ubiquitum TaxID=857276 RepID=A0A1J4MFC7_9CRYT|nr:vacuolar protein sorting 11 [Cryptosporidium ubiquitum]OII72703.1 vacuolar protein sorting 11 [Cryptosporidium ubiquitum]